MGDCATSGAPSSRSGSAPTSIARRSNGSPAIPAARPTFPATVDELAGDYARVVEDLRRRYTISYTSTNSARDGAWRAVQIGMPGATAQVASRGGISLDRIADRRDELFGSGIVRRS